MLLNAFKMLQILLLFKISYFSRKNVLTGFGFNSVQVPQMMMMIAEKRDTNRRRAEIECRGRGNLFPTNPKYHFKILAILI